MAESGEFRRHEVITDTQRTSLAYQVTHQSNTRNTEQTAELISTGWDLYRELHSLENTRNVSNSGRGQSIRMRELESEDYGSSTETD